MSDGAGNRPEGELYTYDAYGNMVTGNTTGQPFRYTGRRWDDETGLYYYRARYYSAELGRFLQTDPIGYEDNMNLYGYTGNDPVNNTDPSGKIVKLLRAGINIAKRTFKNGGNVFKAAKNEALDIADTAATIIDPSSSAVDIAVAIFDLVSPVEVKELKVIADNVKRFTKSVPRGGKNNITANKLPNGGVAVDATVPGNVPGSSAQFEKQIGSDGKTINFTKTTVDPDGNIVHVKDKITNEEIRPDG